MATKCGYIPTHVNIYVLICVMVCLYVCACLLHALHLSLGYLTVASTATSAQLKQQIVNQFRQLASIHECINRDR